MKHSQAQWGSYFIYLLIPTVSFYWRPADAVEIAGQPWVALVLLTNPTRPQASPWEVQPSGARPGFCPVVAVSCNFIMTDPYAFYK